MRFDIALFVAFFCAMSQMPLAGAVALNEIRSSAVAGPSVIASGTFIAFATTSPSGNPQGMALRLSNSNAAQYFYIRNSGTVEITDIALAISYSRPPGKTSFSRCDVGVSFSSKGKCATGTDTAVIASSNLALTLLPGTWYAFELDSRSRTTPTISVSVSVSQIRAPIITNS